MMTGATMMNGSAGRGTTAGNVANEAAAARKPGIVLCAPVELVLEVDVGVHHHRVVQHEEQQLRCRDGASAERILEARGTTRPPAGAP